MKVSFIIPAWNKADHVERAVLSTLQQTYDDMEVVLSDHGSTDGTLEIMQRLAREYRGPKRVRVLQCPETEYRGSAGINRHLDWLMDQVEGDVVISCSADDVNHLGRAEATAEIFQRYNPSWVGTKVRYCHPDGTTRGFSIDLDDSRFLTTLELMTTIPGGTFSSAWARDLWTKYGPTEGVESLDVTMPFYASLERGLYVINIPLHAYIYHASDENAGLHGVFMNARNDEDKDRIVELCGYQMTTSWMTVARKIEEMKIKLSPELKAALGNCILKSTMQWTRARDLLVMTRVQPRTMNI